MTLFSSFFSWLKYSSACIWKMRIPHFLYPPIHEETFRLLPYLCYLINAAKPTVVQILLRFWVQLFWINTRSRIARSRAGSVFLCLLSSGLFAMCGFFLLNISHAFLCHCVDDKQISLKYLFLFSEENYTKRYAFSRDKDSVSLTKQVFRGLLLLCCYVYIP